MTSNQALLEIYKDDPLLAKPWPPISPRDRELARRQRVAWFCLRPSFQKAAKQSPEGEAEYWSKFSVGGQLPNLSTPFSQEQLLSMTYMEIVEAMQALNQP